MEGQVGSSGENKSGNLLSLVSHVVRTSCRPFGTQGENAEAKYGRGNATTAASYCAYGALRYRLLAPAAADKTLQCGVARRRGGAARSVAPKHRAGPLSH